MRYADEKGWCLSESMRQKHDVIFYVALNCDCIEFPVEWLRSVFLSFVTLANFFANAVWDNRFYCSQFVCAASTLCRHSYSIYCSRIKAEIATKTVTPKRMLRVLEPNADVIFIYESERWVCATLSHRTMGTLSGLYLWWYRYRVETRTCCCIPKNKRQKNYRMRIKSQNSYILVRCDFGFVHCKRPITKKCQGFWWISFTFLRLQNQYIPFKVCEPIENGWGIIGYRLLCVWVCNI